MKPSAFLPLAQELVKDSKEPAQRSAVSRAYYAALNRAAFFLERRGVELPDDGKIHTVVSGGIAKDFPALGSQLIDLMDRRGKADYSVWQEWSNDVEEAIEIASHIISVLDAKDA